MAPDAPVMAMTYLTAIGMWTKDKNTALLDSCQEIDGGGGMDSLLATGIMPYVFGILKLGNVLWLSKKCTI